MQLARPSAQYQMTQPNSARIASWIAELDDRQSAVRQRARAALVHAGKPAIEPLIQALTDAHEQVRWEAARAMVDIADPVAAPALVRTLEDEDAGTRWVAAEALIAIGPAALAPLLRALIERGGRLYLREGAHHVLHDFKDGESAMIVAPVFKALDGPSPETAAPVAADDALERLQKAAY